MRGPGEPSLFRSEEGRRLILELCDRHWRRLSRPSVVHTVPTRHGRTHVVEIGAGDAPPVLFLPAIGTHGGLFTHEIEVLAEHFRVLVPDLPGQPGGSEERALPRLGPAMGEWQTDFLDALGARETSVIGYSLGGYYALKLAEHAPERVRSLALLCPAGLSAPPFFKVTPMVWRFALGRAFEGPGWLARAFGGLVPGETAEDPFFEFLEQAALHVRVPLTFYPVLTASQLERFRGPALVLAGELDPIYDVRRQLDGARRVFRDVTPEQLDGLGHVFSNAERARLARRMGDFLRSHPAAPG